MQQGVAVAPGPKVQLLRHGKIACSVVLEAQKVDVAKKELEKLRFELGFWGVFRVKHPSATVHSRAEVEQHTQYQ